MTTFRLSERIGPVLVGRTPAAAVRKQVEEFVRRGEIVVLDFAGVASISPSFADEVFARLDRSLVDAGQIQFDNLSDDLQEIASFFRDAREAS